MSTKLCSLRSLFSGPTRVINAASLEQYLLQGCSPLLIHCRITSAVFQIIGLAASRCQHLLQCFVSAPPSQDHVDCSGRHGSWRPCGDYCRLITVAVLDKYPLPNLQNLFDHLHGATLFSKLDLEKGYCRVPMAKDNIPKMAISTPIWPF